MKRKPVVLIILAIFTVTSCSVWDDLFRSEQTTIRGDVSITLNIAEAMASGYEITRVSIFLTHQASGAVVNKDLTVDAANETASGVLPSLRTGLWDLSIELYESDVLIGSGTSTVDVFENQTAYVVVNVDLVSGDVQVTVNWGTEEPQGPDIVVISPANNTVYSFPTITVEGMVLNFQGDNALNVASLSYTVPARGLNQSVPFDAQSGAFSFTFNIDVPGFVGGIIYINVYAEDIYSNVSLVILTLLEA